MSIAQIIGPAIGAGFVLVIELQRRRQKQTLEYLLDRMTWGAGKTGVSSDAMIRAALGGELVEWHERPRDGADLGRCELAYDLAPKHLKKRMRPMLRQFRRLVPLEPTS